MRTNTRSGWTGCGVPYRIGVNMAFGTDVDIALPDETRGTLAIDYVTMRLI